MFQDPATGTGKAFLSESDSRLAFLSTLSGTSFAEKMSRRLGVSYGPPPFLLLLGEEDFFPKKIR